MRTFRERIVDFALGDEKRKLQSAVNQVYSAYLTGPYALPPDELLRQLSEWDSSVVNDLVTQLGYDRLGSLGGYQTETEAMRQRAIDESRRLWRYAPLAQWGVQTWTNYGLGESVQIVCDDPDADEIWQECWKADRNALLFAPDCIQNLSNNVLVDGNIFLAAYASTIDGQVTWGEILPEEIVEIVTNPENAMQPLFYKRQFTVGTESKVLYYPDWQVFFRDDAEDILGKAKLPANAVRADKVADTENQKTTVCILHIAHNRKARGSLWGYPILYIAAPYLREHKNFLQNRMTVSAAKAMYVRKTQVAGGSRAVSAVRAKLASTLSAANSFETNPPAVAGSTFIENKASDTTDLPMTTGASDAKCDNEILAWITLIAIGLFPTTAGLDTSRWATALAMDKTQAMQWSRYQTFWRAQFDKIVAVTLGYAEKYDSKIFEVKTARVAVDEFSIVDFPGVVTSISEIINVLTPLAVAGALPDTAIKQIVQAMMRVSLKALGVDDEDITSDKTFEIQRAEIPQEVSRVIDAGIKKFGEGKIGADAIAQLLIAEFVESKK